jgi:hypothetical protein
MQPVVLVAKEERWPTHQIIIQPQVQFISPYQIHGRQQALTHLGACVYISAGDAQQSW